MSIRLYPVAGKGLNPDELLNAAVFNRLYQWLSRSFIVSLALYQQAVKDAVLKNRLHCFLPLTLLPYIKLLGGDEIPRRSSNIV